MKKNNLFPLVVVMMATILTFSGCNKTEVTSILTEEPVSEIPASTPVDMETEDEFQPAQEVSQVLQDYTPELFAELKGNQKFALYFAADWCSSCRATMQNITDNPEDFAGVTLLEIDYDNSKELKKEFNIVTQHAFVFFDASGEIVSTKYFPKDTEVIEFFETGV